MGDSRQRSFVQKVGYQKCFHHQEAQRPRLCLMSGLRRSGLEISRQPIEFVMSCESKGLQQIKLVQMYEKEVVERSAVIGEVLGLLRSQLLDVDASMMKSRASDVEPDPLQS